MDVAAAEQDLAGGDADDLAVGEAAAEDLGRLLVVALVEQGEDDALVAEVEVGVGGGEAVAGAARLGAGDGVDPRGLLGGDRERAGGGQADHLEGAAAGVGRRFQPLQRVA